MYAIVKSGGHSYKVSAGDKLQVDYIAGNEGDTVVMDRVLMLGGSQPVIGKPLVEGARVEAVIKKQVKAPKVLVFKYKRRKNYKRTKGHRQLHTVLEIASVNS